MARWRHTLARRAAALVVVVGLAAGARPGFAQPAPETVHARAVALHDEAKALYARGEYRAAIAKLEEALALDPEAKELHYNLALLHERLGAVDEAIRYYQRFVELETDPKSVERVQAILRRLEGARLEVARPEAPRAPVVAPVRSTPVALPVERPTPPPASPWTTVAAAGSGLAFAVGLGFAVSAVATDPGDTVRAGAAMPYDGAVRDARSAHDRAVVADVCFGVAAVAGAAAILLFVLEGDAPGAASAARRGAAVRF